MRKLPFLFIQEINKQANVPIDLVAVEITTAFTSICKTGTGTTTVKLDPSVVTAISDWETDNETTLSADIAACVADLSAGSAWVIGCDIGLNAGSNRIVTGYNSGAASITISGEMDTALDVDADRIRLSKYMFLAAWNKPVEFFIPDKSTDGSQPMTYIPFPIALEPVGTNLNSESLSMKIGVSNVNRIVGDAIQMAGGLRGNRVYHLRVFNGLLDSKDNVITEVMYIDSVSINQEAVGFALESKFNILNVDLPLRNYHRDFCDFTFKSAECGFGWGYANSGFSLNVSGEYPLASMDSCDHTLVGMNGCVAHRNTVRFGGFPSIPPVK
jgi:phage-related protein